MKILEKRHMGIRRRYPWVSFVSVFVLFLVVFFSVLTVNSVFAEIPGSGSGSPGSGSEGGNTEHGTDNSYDPDHTNVVACGGYVCYTGYDAEVSGYAWIYVPTTDAHAKFSDAGPFQNVAPGSANTTSPTAGSDGAIDGCDNAGGYYVLGIVRYYKGGSSTGDVKGPFKLNSMKSGMKYNTMAASADGAMRWADGSYTVTPQHVEAVARAQEAAGRTPAGMGWDQGNMSAICAWDEVEEAEVKMQMAGLECARINGLMDGGSNYGNTWADTYVINYSSSAGMRAMAEGSGYRADGTEFSDNYVFAKHGDSIQFRHRLCSPAQKVAGNQDSKHYGQRATGYTEWCTSGFCGLSAGGGSWGPKTYLNAHGDEGDVVYNFYLTSSNNPNNLFGRYAPLYNNGNSFIPINPHMEYTPMTNPIFSAARSARPQDFNDIGFQIYSPSTDAGDGYKCAPIYTISFPNPFIEPGYQVPGFISQPPMSGACNAAHSPIPNSDGDMNKVGKIVWQAIHWNNIVGFIQTTGAPGLAAGDICENVGGECKTDHCIVADRSYNNVPTDLHNGVCNWGSCTGKEKSDYGIYTKFMDSVSKWGAAGWHCGHCATKTCYYQGCCCCKRYNVPIYNNLGEKVGSYDERYPVGEGGDCCANSSLTQKSDEWYKPVMFYDKTRREEGKEEEIDDAQVWIPYNFSTTDSTYIENMPVVYGGASVTSTWNYTILPKANPYTSSMPYSSITPPNSRVEVVEFIIGPEASGPPSGNTNASTSGVCAYYGAAECHLIFERDGPLNETGNYYGAFYSGMAARTVPDIEVGNKYCTAIGVFPADSLNWQSASTGLLRSLGMQGGTTWNISSPTCRTIAKKPNFQVWNGGLYTPSAIQTGVSRKIVGTGFDTSVCKYGDAPDQCDSHKDSSTTVFGSWEEQLIIAGGTVKGMSSAAGLGYNGNVITQDPETGRLKDGDNHGKGVAYNFALPGGTSPAYSFRQVSNLTLSNVDTMGNSGVKASSTILSRLKARYKNIDENSTTHVNTSANGDGLQYARFAVGTSISEIVNYIHAANNASPSASSGTFVYDGTGDLIKNSLAPNANGTFSDNTLAIQVDGTLTIDRNVCYGATCAGNGAQLGSYSLTVNSISALPQIVIFADNIIINEAVTRIDAWLVVDGTEKSDAGTINTCNVPEGAIHARNCSSVLTVNGPVFAKKLILNRTAGSWPGAGTHEGGGPLNQDLTNDGSITPGEIFNLRADAYYWAYNQAQRYTEAVVTYTRELAPRY